MHGLSECMPRMSHIKVVRRHATWFVLQRAGGCLAAIGAAGEGDSVILLEPTDHVGGMNTVGLSLSDSFGCYRTHAETLGRMQGLLLDWQKETHDPFLDAAELSRKHAEVHEKVGTPTPIPR